MNPPLLLKLRLPAAQVRENRILLLALCTLIAFENFEVKEFLRIIGNFWNIKCTWLKNAGIEV